MFQIEMCFIPLEVMILARSYEWRLGRHEKQKEYNRGYSGMGVLESALHRVLCFHLVAPNRLNRISDYDKAIMVRDWEGVEARRVFDSHFIYPVFTHKLR